MSILSHVENCIATHSLPDGYTSPLLTMVEKTHTLGATSMETERSVRRALARVLAAVATVAFETSAGRDFDAHSVAEAIEQLTMRRFDERRTSRALANAPAWEFMRAAVLTHPQASRKDTVFCAEALHVAKRTAEAYAGELLEHATVVAKSHGRDTLSPSDIELVESVQLCRPIERHARA
jgi:histone H3/H4